MEEKLPEIHRICEKTCAWGGNFSGYANPAYKSKRSGYEKGLNCAFQSEKIAYANAGDERDPESSGKTQNHRKSPANLIRSEEHV